MKKGCAILASALVARWVYLCGGNGGAGRGGAGGGAGASRPRPFGELCISVFSHCVCDPDCRELWDGVAVVCSSTLCYMLPFMGTRNDNA